jgi:hypothetical protein
MNSTIDTLQDEYLKENLQPVIIPGLVAANAVKPNALRIVEGPKVLDRAQEALNLRRSGVSGERVVWRFTSDDGTVS